MSNLTNAQVQACASTLALAIALVADAGVQSTAASSQVATARSALNATLFTTIVSSTSSLYSAVAAAAPGDRIGIAPGSYVDPYGAVQFTNVNKPGLVISATDLANKPVFPAGLKVSGCTGLTFYGFEVPSPTGNTRTTTFAVSGCVDCVVDQMYIHGDLDGVPGDVGGINFRNCTNFTLQNSYFEELANAVSWRDCDTALIAYNVFFHIGDNDMEGDGTDNIIVRGNISRTKLRVPGATAHPDCIQMAGTAANPQPKNILIEDNIGILGRGGGASQVAWLNNAGYAPPSASVPVGTIMFQGTVVANGNISVGSGPNGQMVNNAAITRFDNAICLGYEGNHTVMGARLNVGTAPDGSSASVYPSCEVHFTNSLACYAFAGQPNNIYGHGMIGTGTPVPATKYDDGGNTEIPLLTVAQAEQLYDDLDAIMVAVSPDRRSAIGVRDLYAAKIKQRVNGWFGLALV